MFWDEKDRVSDVAELFKLAGRDVGGASFESQVPSELQQLRREMRAGFKRLDQAIGDVAKRLDRE